MSPEGPSSPDSSVGNEEGAGARFAIPLLVLLVVVVVVWTIVLPTFGTDTTHADPSRIGFAQAYTPLFESSRALRSDFAAIAATGARWVRFDMTWSVIQPDGPTSFDWGATDRAVAAARSHGLHVLATLAYTPKWARAPGTKTDKYPPVDPADFARFARAAVQRYAPLGVHHYEVWNEPNTGFWAPKPDPVAYSALLEQAYVAIHGVDPKATVLSGGLAPQGPVLDWVASDGSGMSPWHFLAAMYGAGARGSFDALAHHPYTIPYGPRSPTPANALLQTVALHALMVDHGDGAKRIWATEVGSFTGTADGAVSEGRQALELVDSVTIWQQWPYTGPLFVYTLRDRSARPSEREDNFGLLTSEGAPKDSYVRLRELLRPR